MGWWLDWRVAPLLFLLVSFGLIIMAIVGPLKVSDEINKKLTEEFLFTQAGQPGWNRFVNNTQSDSAQTYLKITIVNTTNWQDVQTNGSRPILQEVGPYVFRQYIVNSNYQFSYLMNNYTFTQVPDGLSERVITFVPWIYLVWDEGNPLNGNRTLNDTFTVPNFGVWSLYNNPLLTSDQKTQLTTVVIYGYPPMTPPYLVPPSTPFQSRTANELLFGYVDPLLSFLASQGLAPTNKFQFIRNQTDPSDAASQVNTTTLSCGFPNTVRFQQMIVWQNKSSINYWKNGLVPKGTPGNYFGFDERGKSQDVQLFWAQVARYLTLNEKGESDIKGVKTWHYVFDPKEIYNVTNNPVNDKYYQYGPNGLLNATTINSAAIYYSWPHFYLGDESLSNWYDGYPQPNQTNDENYVEVEKITGLTVKGRRLIQGNVPVGGIVNPGWPYNMSYTYMWPTYWMALESEMTDAQADQLRDALDFYDRAVGASQGMLIGGALGACIAFLISLGLFYKRREQWKRGTTVGLLAAADQQQNEDVPIGYVETSDQPTSPSYGARTEK